MENEQSNDQQKDPKNDPKDQARNLFFQTGLTQAQIAELVGVSQKTISLWMNEGKWKMLKEMAEQAPTVLIEQMSNELSELHNNIATREPGKRYATNSEAEIRRKIMLSIKSIRQQQTAGVHSEVLSNFAMYVRKKNHEDAKKIVLYADQYLKGEKQFGLNAPFKSYSLPGQIEIPKPSGFPPGDNSTNPPTDKDKPADLNNAA